jgi:parvulin-like peptidyl-prolyl isomerase
MMRISALVLCLLSAACAQAPEPTERPPADDAVAVWGGGQVGLAEIESRYPEARTPACRTARQGGSSVELLIPCFREIAEEIVLEQHVIAEIGEPDPSLLDDGGVELRRHAHILAFRSTLMEEIEVTEEEILALFEERRETLQRPASLTLWNLFRRHRNTEKPEDTTAFLLEIKARVEAGETFQSLARQFSDSETRLRDGLVGRVSEGDLPARLEEIAFDLDTGQVSQPIPVRGGAVLLYIRDPQPRAEPEFNDMRQMLRAELQAESFRDRVRERLEGEELPRGSTVLEDDALVTMVATGEGSEIVLEIGDQQLSVTELREMARFSDGQPSAGQREILTRIYHELVESERLYLDILTADDPLATAARDEAVDHLREETVGALLTEALEQAVAARVDGDAEALRQYFEDNEHHYQSRLRFRLRLWSQPFGPDPPAQLAAMERARESLTTDERTLDDVVDELAGEIQDLGWRELDSLSELPGKAQSLLLQTDPGGYTVPYQQDEVLYLIELTERSEPKRLAYDEVAGQVRDDYIMRFGQRLTREVMEIRLTEADFQFFEDQARRLLESP